MKNSELPISLSKMISTVEIAFELLVELIA